MDFSSYASEQESVSLTGAALKTMLTFCSDVLGDFFCLIRKFELSWRVLWKLRGRGVALLSLENFRGCFSTNNRQIFGINSEKSTSEDHRKDNRNTHNIGLENGTVIEKFLAVSWIIEISTQYLLLRADILPGISLTSKKIINWNCRNIFLLISFHSIKQYLISVN